MTGFSLYGGGGSRTGKLNRDHLINPFSMSGQTLPVYLISRSPEYASLILFLSVPNDSAAFYSHTVLQKLPLSDNIGLDILVCHFISQTLAFY